MLLTPTLLTGLRGHLSVHALQQKPGGTGTASGRKQASGEGLFQQRLAQAHAAFGRGFQRTECHFKPRQLLFEGLDDAVLLRRRRQRNRHPPQRLLRQVAHRILGATGLGFDIGPSLRRAQEVNEPPLTDTITRNKTQALIRKKQLGSAYIDKDRSANVRFSVGPAYENVTRADLVCGVEFPSLGNRLVLGSVKLPPRHGAHLDDAPLIGLSRPRFAGERLPSLNALQQVSKLGPSPPRRKHPLPIHDAHAQASS